MNGIIFDLKNFRKKRMNGMSQEEFAKQIGISQDKVSRMEADPTQVSLEILFKIATHFGMTMDELVKLPEPSIQGVKVQYTWSSVEYIRKKLYEYIEKNKFKGNYTEKFQELSVLIGKITRKPKVAFVGRSDVGKSTMINTLLGTNRMPAHWTPATAIAVFIKHTKDRPSYMDEDVWIFQSDPDTNDVWDDTRLNDEEYCRSLKLSAGNYELLNSYGTRKGEKFSESKATSAVVFIDSSLLLNCDIIDLPGYGTGDRVEDDKLSLREKDKADVIVYMSIANGFMRGEDISYVKDSISSLADVEDYNGIEKIKPLANLFIVASQAHVIDNGNVNQLNTILEAGCERFEKSLTEGFWEDRKRPELLLDRFYTYTSNKNKYELRERFEKDFCKLIEYLPQVVECRALNIIKEWAKNQEKEFQNVIEEYDQLLQSRKQFEEALKEYDRNEPKRYGKFQRDRQKIIEKIYQYRCESLCEIDKFYLNMMTVDNLVSLMEKRNVRKKKEDLQIFSSYISGLLQDKINMILKEKSKLLAISIDEFLENFESNTAICLENNISFKVNSFNKEQAFAAGLAGVMTYGALAIWAASCGNLGGYILVAKGVSLLSALGISVGGTAVATSAVAAIGGPVVLGITLALIAAIAVFAIFSGSWKKNIAKKIVNSCREEQVLEKIRNNISEYWIDTQIAFDKSADSLDEKWKIYLRDLKKKIKSYDVKKLNDDKADAEKMKNFFQKIPF